MRKLLVIIATLAVALATAGTAAAQEATGTVTVIHGVPDVAVDVYVNDELTLSGFEFGTITDPLELPEGDYAIAIRPAGEDASTDPIIAGSTTLPGGANASIIAHLDEGGNPTLSVFVNDIEPIAAGDARLAVRHTAAAPAVDVIVNGEVAVAALANPDGAQLDVPADTYTAEVAPAGTTDVVIGPADLTLDAGTAYLVYAVGSVDGGLELLVQTVDGLGESPSGIPAGDSGLVASGGFPAWALALLIVAGLGAAGSALLLVRGRTSA